MVMDMERGDAAVIATGVITGSESTSTTWRDCSSCNARTVVVVVVVSGGGNDIGSIMVVVEEEAKTGRTDWFGEGTAVCNFISVVLVVLSAITVGVYSETPMIVTVEFSLELMEEEWRSNRDFLGEME